MREEAQRTGSATADCWSGNVRAERYDRAVNRRFYDAALARLLKDAPVLRGRGLDLGCGTGFSTERLRQAMPEVVWQGVDASAAMLAVARRKPELSAVPLARACADALPFPDASFDVVVASFSWHWFGPGAAVEVRRVLRLHGWLLAAVPVRQVATAAGNRALARSLLGDRRRYASRPSQGLRLTDLPRLLSPPARVVRQELAIERERFSGAAELLDVLDSRGALTAIFGEVVPSALVTPSPVDFEWPFALVHLQREG
jgi:SAM-dependent methyltransferase